MYIQEIEQDEQAVSGWPRWQPLIIVESGRPVRLNFRLEETASCSDKVIFPDFQKGAELPRGQSVAIELLPKAAGEFGFACPMGTFPASSS